MRFKTAFALSGILLLTFAGAVDARMISRWLRMPYSSNSPAILRHPIGAPQSPGFNFQFSYEKTPVRPMERLINRSIPEATPAQVDSEEVPGIVRSALRLEELDREAEEALANPPASTSFTHLFLQQQKQPENASHTEVIASISQNLPEENMASSSFLPTASGTIPASGSANIKATGTAIITASGTAAVK